MTTLALHDLKPARSNVLNFVARLQAVHGSPTVSTPDEAVRCAVQCARSVIREPDSVA
jgi:hypothetical protein